jgi:hypothetical protein
MNEHTKTLLERIKSIPEIRKAIHNNERTTLKTWDSVSLKEEIDMLPILSLYNTEDNAIPDNFTLTKYNLVEWHLVVQEINRKGL